MLHSNPIVEAIGPGGNQSLLAERLQSVPAARIVFGRNLGNGKQCSGRGLEFRPEPQHVFEIILIFEDDDGSVGALAQSLCDSGNWGEWPLRDQKHSLHPPDDEC